MNAQLNEAAEREVAGSAFSRRELPSDSDLPERFLD